MRAVSRMLSDKLIKKGNRLDKFERKCEAEIFSVLKYVNEYKIGRKVKSTTLVRLNSNSRSSSSRPYFFQ